MECRDVGNLKRLSRVKERIGFDPLVLPGLSVNIFIKISIVALRHFHSWIDSHIPVVVPIGKKATLEYGNECKKNKGNCSLTQERTSSYFHFSRIFPPEFSGILLGWLSDPSAA